MRSCSFTLASKLSAMCFGTADARILVQARAAFIAFWFFVWFAVFCSPRAVSQARVATGSTDKPSVSLVFVIDNALLDKDSANVRTIVTTFLRSLRDDDEYAIYVSDEHPVLVQDFGGDPELADTALRPTGNRRTALYETLVTAAQFADSDASNDRKILLVLSSGVDSGSNSRLADAIAAVNNFAIHLVVISFPEGGWRGHRTLQQLATESGGKIYLPEHKSDFEEVATLAAHELIGPAVTRVKPLARYRYIVVRSIPVAELPRTAEFHPGDNAVLEKLLAARLWEARLFYRVIDATQQPEETYLAQSQTADAADKVEVSGAIVQYKRGSHLKRGTGGLLGSGVSRIKVRFVFRDVASRKAVLALTEEGAGSGGLLGGGNDENQREAMERVVDHLLQHIKRNR
jgi:hypothetical protein